MANYEMLVGLGRRYKLDLPAGTIAKIGELQNQNADDPEAPKAV